MMRSMGLGNASTKAIPVPHPEEKKNKRPLCSLLRDDSTIWIDTALVHKLPETQDATHNRKPKDASDLAQRNPLGEITAQMNSFNLNSSLSANKIGCKEN
jgi:hypothetical protein